MHFTAQPQTVSLDLTSTGIEARRIKILLTDDPSLRSTSTLQSDTLPPYATWIASVQ